MILEKSYSHKDSISYKSFTSGRLTDEKELVIGILRETKIPHIYFVDLKDFEENKNKWAKISEDENERHRSILDNQSEERTDFMEGVMDSFMKKIADNPELKNFFSDMQEAQDGTYKNTRLYNLENILYKDKLKENKRNITGLESLRSKSWMFRDQDLEKLKLGTIKSRYILQINDTFNRSVDFYNDKKYDKVYFYDDVINDKDVLNDLCSKYNDVNILAAFNSLIEQGVITEFPYNIKDRFSKYIDFV